MSDLHTVITASLEDLRTHWRNIKNLCPSFYDSHYRELNNQWMDNPRSASLSEAFERDVNLCLESGHQKLYAMAAWHGFHTALAQFAAALSVCQSFQDPKEWRRQFTLQISSWGDFTLTAIFVDVSSSMKCPQSIGRILSGLSGELTSDCQTTYHITDEYDDTLARITARDDTHALKVFHHFTDGCMSNRSLRVYDPMTAHLRT